MRGTESEKSGNNRVLEKARERMVDALRLLDAGNAASDIGAHLDTAISRLEDVIRTRDG